MQCPQRRYAESSVDEGTRAVDDAGLLGPSPLAWANHPERPVRIAVGFGAGSAADLAARIVGEDLGWTMAQHFIVENRPDHY